MKTDKKREDHYVNIRTDVFNLLKTWCATNKATIVDTATQWIEAHLRVEAAYKLNKDELAEILSRPPSEQA